MTAGQATYDLRRLRTHGLIERVPHTHRYTVTDHGLQTAMLLTRIHDRILPSSLADQLDPASTADSAKPPSTTNTSSTHSPTRTESRHLRT